MNPQHHSYSVAINPSPSENADITVLFSGHAQPVPMHQMGPAIHDYYLIHTVTSGKGEFIIRDECHKCGPGDTFIIFPGELFSYQADLIEPWHYMWVAFVGHGAAESMALIDASPEQPIISGSFGPSLQNYYDQLHRCFDSASFPELVNLEAGGWVRLLFRELGLARKKLVTHQYAADSAVDLVVKQAIQFLSLQFTQPISIEHMSSMFGYHRTHLCKLFKQSTGLSPMQYLLRIRMQRAELLLATSMPVDQVASSVGFSDALYFSKKFRKWQGQSPTEYRKALRSIPKRSYEP